MRETAGRVVDVMFLDVGPDGESLPGWVNDVLEEYAVTHPSSVDAAAEVLESLTSACLVVTGETDAVASAVERLHHAGAAATILAVVDSADTDEGVEILEAGATDLLPNGDSETVVRLAETRIDRAVETAHAEARAAMAYESHDVLLEEASVPVLLIAADGTIVHATAGAATYLEYDDPGALVDDPVWTFVHPGDRDGAMQGFDRVVQEQVSVPESEIRLTTADGETRYAAVSTSPAYYDGELVAQAIAKDVTDRYDPVRALQHHHQSVLPAALSVLEDLLFVADSEWQFTFGNDHLRSILGYDEAEFTSLQLADCFPPEERDDAMATLESVFETGAITLETPVLTADGETIDCEFRLRSIENDHGDVVGVVGVGQDVSDRLRREHSLRTLNTVATELKTCESPAEACERTVAAATTVLDMEFCGVSLVDDTGEQLEVVAESEELDEAWTMRMHVDEGVAGLTYRTGRSFHVDELDGFEEAEPLGSFHSLISVPVGKHGVFQAVADDPNAFDETDLELAELLAGHCETALDRIEREERLRSQNARLEEFASVVSHDLRNPLTLLQAELEEAEASGDPESFDRVRDAIDRMDGLIGDLLELARAGEGVSETEPVDLEAEVVRCWGTVSSSLNATLEIDALPTVDADRVRLRQLFENLFRNAVEHGSTSNRTQSGDAVEHGRGNGQPSGNDAETDNGEGAADWIVVTVGSLPNDGGFFVEDDGVGIPVDKRETVFESGYTTNTDGTGFGLQIVEDVATAHGWTVSVTESDAGGARFEIRT